MSIINKRLGLAAAAVAGMTVLGLYATPARADKKYVCKMTGHWIEQKEEWVFQAEYTAKDAGADFFKGLYMNLTAGTTARVEGAADKGTWLIKLIYTDKAHVGQTRELIGTGRGTPSLLTITGNYTYKQDVRQIGQGQFQLVGECK